MKMKKIYIAGPMSGYPEFNFPAFFAAAGLWKAKGWLVFNPAAKEEEKALDPEACKVGDDKLAVANGFDFRQCFEWDLCRVVEADAIYMLPGWEASSGARAEHAAAIAIKARYPEYKIIYA